MNVCVDINLNPRRKNPFRDRQPPDVCRKWPGRQTDRKSLLALRGVGPESEAENARFHGRRVTKVGPGSQTRAFSGCGARSQPEKAAAGGLGPLNKGCERCTWALPDVSGGRERHDRFSVRSRGRGRRATDRGSFRRVGAAMHAHPLLPEPEMAQDALDDILPGQ
jgi:hypothetical protein